MKALPREQRQPSEIDYVTRNEKCITCSEFDVSRHTKLSSSMSQSDQKIPHIRETILDICNYPHRSRTMGANFRQCRFILASLFTEAGMNKKELEKASKPFEWVS